MADYDMTGYIGKNKFKKTDKHPDITGKITVDGVQYEVAGWQKESKGDHGGSKYYSLKIQLPRQMGEDSKKDVDGITDMKDDIPF